MNMFAYIYVSFLRVGVLEMTWPEGDVMRILKGLHNHELARVMTVKVDVINESDFLPAALSCAIQTNKTPVFLSHVSGFI